MQGKSRPLLGATVVMQTKLLEPAAFIRILPRAGAPPTVQERRCETCNKRHDGTFGAGRFCSSRCARTVGGLAHRRKRAQERSMRRHSISRAGQLSHFSASLKAKTSGVSYPSRSSSSMKRPSTHKRVMISMLLNPS